MYHPADLWIRLQAAGPFACMELAAQRGDLAGFKDALISTYGPMAEKVYHKTVAQSYEWMLKEAYDLMDSTDKGDEDTLTFWATLIEGHERRAYGW